MAVVRPITSRTFFSSAAAAADETARTSSGGGAAGGGGSGCAAAAAGVSVAPVVGRCGAGFPVGCRVLVAPVAAGAGVSGLGGDGGATATPSAGVITRGGGADIASGGPSGTRSAAFALAQAHENASCKMQNAKIVSR